MPSVTVEAFVHAEIAGVTILGLSPNSYGADGDVLGTAARKPEALRWRPESDLMQRRVSAGFLAGVFTSLVWYGYCTHYSL